MNSCECQKTTKRDEDKKKKLANRLSRIEGQVRGLKTMLENDAYCIDILTQASAVSSALDSFMKELLESHIRGCVVSDIKDGKDESIDELILTLGKMIG